MAGERLILSPKYKAFLRCSAPVEFMEGTTAAGKTTVGLYKFMLKVAGSEKKLHIIAADDTGAAEKNIIQKDLGILDDFGILTEYRGGGSATYKMPHIIFHTTHGDKVILIVGYSNKSKWKDALGGQYGCLYIDEINTANIEFVREAAMRADYLLATLNPDDPALPIYHDYINCSRPLQEWESDIPKEILDELKEEPKPGWVYWFFSFRDNAALSAEMLQRIIQNTPKGTKIWKNKIIGLRGKATGLVFSNFSRKLHTFDPTQLRQDMEAGKGPKFIQFTAAMDTSYSQQSEDTIAMIFAGIAADRRLYVLEEKVYNNKDLGTPLAPSDTAVKFLAFLDLCKQRWGLSRNVFIDSADQATITELKKYKRLRGSIYTFNGSYKKIRIIDRIELQLGWIQQGCYLVSKKCTAHLDEIDRYSWKEDKDEPEDRNDHTINASQYAWIPYLGMIGYEKPQEDK